MKKRTMKEFLFFTCSLLYILNIATAMNTTSDSSNTTSSETTDLSFVKMNTTPGSTYVATNQVTDHRSSVGMDTAPGTSYVASTQSTAIRSSVNLDTTPGTSYVATTQSTAIRPSVNLDTTPGTSYVATTQSTATRSSVNLDTAPGTSYVATTPVITKMDVTSAQFDPTSPSLRPLPTTDSTTKISIITALKPDCPTIKPQPPVYVTRIIPGKTVVVKIPGPTRKVIVEKKVYLTYPPESANLNSGDGETSFGTAGLPLFSLVLTVLIILVVVLVLRYLYRKKKSGRHYIKPEGNINNGRMGAPFSGRINAGFEDVDTVDLEEEKMATRPNEGLLTFKNQDEETATQSWVKIEPAAGAEDKEDTSLLNRNSSDEDSDDDGTSNGGSEYKPSDEEDVPQPYKPHGENQNSDTQSVHSKSMDETEI